MAVNRLAGTVNKHPLEKYGVKLRFRSPDIEAGETINTVDVSILQTFTAGGLTLDGAPVINNTNDTVVQKINAGLDGVDYELQFLTKTDADHDYVDHVIVKVEE